MGARKVRDAAEIRSIVGKNMKLTNEQLVLDNMKFALKIAHEYKNYGAPWDDIVQSAYLGLADAAKHFKRERGIRFISFAVYYIRMHIRDMLTFHNNPIRQPTSHTRKLGKIKKSLAKNSDQDSSALSDSTGLKELSVKRVLANKINGFVSLNQAVGNGSEGSTSTLEDVLALPNPEPAPDELANVSIALGVVEGRMALLTKIEAYVLKERFYGDRTLDSIGKTVKRTPAGVKAILDRGLVKLRAGFAL